MTKLWTLIAEMRFESCEVQICFLCVPCVGLLLSTPVEVKLSLSKPWSCMGGVNIQLHQFLTSILSGGEFGLHSRSKRCAEEKNYLILNNLIFFWPCIMNWLYINYQLWCTDYYYILFSSTRFEPQVLIFRRIQLYTCSIWCYHSLWEFLVACRYTAWVRTDCRGKVAGRAS